MFIIASILLGILLLYISNRIGFILGQESSQYETNEYYTKLVKEIEFNAFLIDKCESLKKEVQTLETEKANNWGNLQ